MTNKSNYTYRSRRESIQYYLEASSRSQEMPPEMLLTTAWQVNGQNKRELLQRNSFSRHVDPALSSPQSTLAGESKT